MPPKGKKSQLSQVQAENGVIVEAGSDVQVYAGPNEPPYVAHVLELRASKHDAAKLKVTWYYYPEDVPRGRQPYHGRLEIFRSNHVDEISSKSVMNLCTVLSLEKWVDHIVTKDPNRPDYRGPVSLETRESEGDNTAFNGKLANGAGGSEAGPSGQQYGDPGASTSKRASADDAVADPNKAPGKKARSDGNAGADENNGGANNGEEEGSGEEEEEEGSEGDSVPPTYMCRHEYDAHKQAWKDVEVSVYCICNQPYNPDMDMVQCMNCAEWYHPECISMPASTLKAIGDGKGWQCRSCGEEGLMEPPGWSQAGWIGSWIGKAATAACRLISPPRQS